MATFTNQATLSYNNTTVNSNLVTGELVEVLSAAKTAVQASYSPNDDVTYVISIVNSGTAPFTDLTVTDDLGGYPFGTETVYPLAYSVGSLRYYVNGVLQPTPTVAAESPLTVTGINVPAGGNALLVYEADVTAFAPRDLESTVTNTATVSGSGLSTPVTAEETVNAEAGPALSVTKSLNPVSVAENGTLTYTFVIANSGNAPATATDTAALSDQFDPILSNLTVTFNGEVWSEPADYSYDTASGLFTTVPGRITVPAATFSQDPVSGAWVTTPGTATLVVTGIV